MYGFDGFPWPAHLFVVVSIDSGLVVGLSGIDAGNFSIGDSRHNRKKNKQRPEPARSTCYSSSPA